MNEFKINLQISMIIIKENKKINYQSRTVVRIE